MLEAVAVTEKEGVEVTYQTYGIIPCSDVGDNSGCMWHCD